jgi:hypothetical protein
MSEYVRVIEEEEEGIGIMKALASIATLRNGVLLKNSISRMVVLMKLTFML